MLLKPSLCVFLPASPRNFRVPFFILIFLYYLSLINPITVGSEPFGGSTNSISLSNQSFYIAFGGIVRTAAIPSINQDATFGIAFSSALDCEISKFPKQDLLDFLRVLSGLAIARGTDVIGCAKAS